MRGRGSPRDRKVVRSPDTARENTPSPDRKKSAGAVREERIEAERLFSEKGDDVLSDSAGQNVASVNGVLTSKSVVVDEVVLEVKSSLNTRLDTAAILKDLEEKRMQQLSGVEDSSKIGLGGGPPLETGAVAEMKGFNKPVKRGSKERALTVDDAIDDEETELIDDWRDDIKFQGREKPKSKDKKERLVSKASRHEEERLITAAAEIDSGVAVPRDVQNGNDYDDAVKGPGGLFVETQAEIVTEVGGWKELKLPVNGTNHRSRRVTENVSIATFEFSDGVKKSSIERHPVLEEFVSSNVKETKLLQEGGSEKTSVVEIVKQGEVLGELVGTPKPFGLDKDPIASDRKGGSDEEMGEDADDETKSRVKPVEASELADGDDGRVRREFPGVDAEGIDQELVIRKKSVEAGAEEKPRDRRSRKKLRDVDDEDGEKRRRKKSQEAGDEGEEEDRRRDRHRRHRRHHKKHRLEDAVEKGEDEDEEEEDADQRKERRRLKKKQRKDDEERREKKRRKHRHHRRKRSASESTEVPPSGGDKVKEDNDDDTSTKQKRRRSRRSSERSPSVEAEKVGVESDEVLKKKKSSSRSHKKKRREASKSASESPSSSD